MAQCAAFAGHYGVPTIMVTGDEATCREARDFSGAGCVTVAVKRGLSREAAKLYPFDETRRALYESRRPVCQPYNSRCPSRRRKSTLVFDDPSGKGRKVTKEGTIENVLKLFDF